MLQHLLTSIAKISSREPTILAFCSKIILEATSASLRDLDEMTFPSSCFIFDAKVPGLAAYFDIFMTSGLTRSKSSFVCRNCSSLSPGNPTMTSVAMEIVGNLERRRLMMAVKSETVTFCSSIPESYLNLTAQVDARTCRSLDLDRLPQDLP